MSKKLRRKKRPTKSIALSFFLLFALTILYSAGPVAAQEHFVLDSFVGAGAYFTDNVFFRNTEKDSDIYFVLQPGANLTIPLYSRNFSMGLGYKLSVYYYTSNSDMSRFLHDFDIAVGFGKEFTKRPGFLRDLKVTINDEVDSVTRVLRFGEDDPLNMVQRNRFQLRPVYEHSFTRKLKLVGEYQFQRVDYFDSDTNSFIGNDLSGILKRIMNQYVTLYGALEMMQRIFDSPEKYTNVGDYIGFQLRLGADLTWRRLTGGIFGGYSMYMASGEADIDYDVDKLPHTVRVEDRPGPVFMLKVNYLLSRRIELNTSFSRYYRVDVAGELIPEMMGSFQSIFKFSKNFMVKANASYRMYEDLKSVPVDLEVLVDTMKGAANEAEAAKIYDDFIRNNLGDVTLLSFGLGASYEFYRGLSLNLEFHYQTQTGADGVVGEEHSKMRGGVMVRYDFKTIRFIL